MQVAFVGNMTGPVELRFTQSGKAVGNVTVARSRKRGDDEQTDFVRVSLWEGLAEHAAQLDKGTRVIVSGRMESREYETKDGEKRTVWEVTADAFGPDLRWATAVVTRTGGRGGVVPSSGAPAIAALEPGEAVVPVGWDADAPF